ncbi:TPA: relaxosome protein TraM [Klebsiella aerogenes]|nr:relaxosome protein TraM [Klebsiella aerogenes]
MPRQHIYLAQKAIDEIRRIVDERQAEGATQAEANISSVTSELIDIGLRVVMMRNKKTDSNQNPEYLYRKALLEESVKSRMVSQELLKMISSMGEVKNDPHFNYSKMVESLKQDIEKRVCDILGDNSE